jgi:hypothetical protein
MRELQNDELDIIYGGLTSPAAPIRQIAIVVNSTGQEIIQIGGSQLTIIVNDQVRADREIGPFI